MKIAKTLGAIGALIAAALLGGTLISAVAAESPTATPDANPGPYCQSFRDHLADALGTDDAALESAFRSAANATLDEAVANGDLSQERADALKARLADADLDGCAGLGRRLLGAPHPALRADLGSAAAEALEMQPSELAAALRSGKSLEDVARDQGVEYDTVKAAVLDSARADLDKAVEAGKITADHEQDLLARLEKALDAGSWPGGGRHPQRPVSGQPGA